MPSIYTPGPLASMCGLPEPLVSALLRLKKFQAMGEDELVTTLLELHSAIDDLDHSLIVSIVSECEASRKAEEIVARLKSFAEDMRKSKEHAKLVLMTQQKQAQEAQAQSQAKAQAQAHEQTQAQTHARPTYTASPQGNANQPQWGQPSQAEERPFYSVLPTTRKPEARTPPPQQQDTPVAAPEPQPLQTQKEAKITEESKPSDITPRSTQNTPTESTTDQPSLSASKSGGKGWLSWLIGGSKNNSVKGPSATEEEDASKRRATPTSQPVPSDPIPKQEEDRKGPSPADNDVLTPDAQPADIKEEKKDEINPFSSSSTPPSSSPSKQGPNELPIVSQAAAAMFGDGSGTPQDSPSYGIAAIKQRPDLFGTDHLDDRSANRFEENHFDPIVSSTPLREPFVNFGAPNSGASNTERKDSEVIFEDVFNSFLSKEQK